jgi:transcriptional antiterminator RfaH
MEQERMPTSLASAAEWYVVQCKSRQEERAEDNLRNQHFACYRPVQQVEAVRHGKRVTVDEPLFPGYLFVHLSRITDNWSSIRSTRGVLRLVSFGDMPVPVPAGVVNEIKRRLGGVVSRPLFEPGSRVVVTDGPFKDLSGIFSRASGEERAIVFLNMLQRQQALTFPVRMLRSAM